MKTYEEFTTYCDKLRCLRNTMTSKNCAKEYKREKCYKKWTTQQTKTYAKNTEKDEEWETCRKEVWLRDAGYFNGNTQNKNWESVCRYWKSLSSTEKEIIKKNTLYTNPNNSTIEVAHIKGKGSNPELYYDIDNLILISHTFHSLIDNYINPLTLKSMKREERDEIFEKILQET